MTAAGYERQIKTEHDQEGDRETPPFVHSRNETEALGFVRLAKYAHRS